MYLTTIDEAEATGRIAEIYAEEQESTGFLMSAIQCWTTRPDMLPMWSDFIRKLRGRFSLGPREWRLITLIAAKKVPSTYCSFVYGKQLIGDLGSREKVAAVCRDHRHADLTPRDIAMLDYAEKIADNASQVTKHDIDRLRLVGFTDVQIFDIALCASMRCFLSRLFDAVGAGPEEAFIDPDDTFRATLMVGRPI
jgi:uncharacterized peroxidase-related enzyme